MTYKTKAEYLGWLQQTPASSGECDRCHQDHQALWRLPGGLDREPDADWRYCRSCFAAIVERSQPH